MIDSKGRDFGLFWARKSRDGWPQKEKREQAPALRAQLSTGVSVSQIRDLSRAILGRWVLGDLKAELTALEEKRGSELPRSKCVAGPFLTTAPEALAAE
jgi:hypothetical protein